MSILGKTLAFACLGFAAVSLRADPATADVMFPLIPELEHPVGTEVLFGPKDNIEARVISAIKSAKSEVLVNHYMITSAAVQDALAKKFAEKKVVITVLDAKPSVRDYKGIENLRAAKVPVVAITHSGGQWNNSKYLIIDRSVVLIGTGDLTNAAKRNDEVLMVMSEPSIVISFYNHFVTTARNQTASK